MAAFGNAEDALREEIQRLNNELRSVLDELSIARAEVDELETCRDDLCTAQADLYNTEEDLNRAQAELAVLRRAIGSGSGPGAKFIRFESRTPVMFSENERPLYAAVADKITHVKREYNNGRMLVTVHLGHGDSICLDADFDEVVNQIEAAGR